MAIHQHIDRQEKKQANPDVITDYQWALFWREKGYQRFSSNIWRTMCTHRKRTEGIWRDSGSSRYRSSIVSYVEIDKV